MNKDKVYLEGYVVGHAADTLGYKGLMVQLENLDIVEIDKDLVHKNINEPQPIKLKDVIARIGEFNLATKAVWINEILNKLGSDYGTLKYKDGYEQGKLEGAMEREKVTIPQFVADWLNENDLREETLGKQSVFDVFDSLKNDSKNGYYENVKRWINENGDLFARAWLDGYEVEEKRYLVKLKGIHSESEYLYYGMGSCKWRLKGKNESGSFRKNHTRKELEEAGFGWVFDCSGIEIEEVE